MSEPHDPNQTADVRPRLLPVRWTTAPPAMLTVVRSKAAMVGASPVTVMAEVTSV